MTRQQDPIRSSVAFSELAETHRRELQAHCFRMLRSVEDSEDMVQETLLRAWRNRDTFEGRSSLRTWLYRIATNVCLDALERRNRRMEHTYGRDAEGVPEGRDPLLERIADSDASPDDEIAARETLELTLLAAVHLPPRQRAVLFLREVVGLSAKETASALGDSVISVNSALQRARQGLRDHLPERRIEWPRERGSSCEDHALVRRLIEGIERAGVEPLPHAPVGWTAQIPCAEPT
jgi:RNA polymerase sigma-70 factor, ECF subfamily